MQNTELNINIYPQIISMNCNNKNSRSNKTKDCICIFFPFRFRKKKNVFFSPPKSTNLRLKPQIRLHFLATKKHTVFCRWHPGWTMNQQPPRGKLAFWTQSHVGILERWGGWENHQRNGEDEKLHSGKIDREPQSHGGGWIRKMIFLFPLGEF